MKKIVLCCSDGMSTSMLVQRMKAAADKETYLCDILACPIAQIGDKGKDADVVLLGPQVKYQLKKVQAIFPDKPVAAIEPVDYGMMRGDKVMMKAKELMGE